MAKEKTFTEATGILAESPKQAAPAETAAVSSKPIKERKRHVYGDTESVFGSPIAEWTVEGEFRLPGRTIPGEMAFLVITAMLRVLHRNSPGSYDLAIKAVASVAEELERGKLKVTA